MPMNVSTGSGITLYTIRWPRENNLNFYGVVSIDGTSSAIIYTAKQFADGLARLVEFE